jgi:lipoate-protein ligase A
MTLRSAPPILRRRHGSATMRLLDLGTVPWIRSQSVHHAVATCFGEETPDTVVLVRPDRPYVCVGHHGLGPQPSPAAVRRLGLPVVRRRLGGGTVLITPAQTFYVLVVHRRRLPLPDPAALRWCLGPVVAAYARLGVVAEAGPGTDVTGAGRKLCGSGAASVGEASVFGGNVLGDFDPELFLEALQLPSAEARRLMGEELSAQMGSVRQATGAVPVAEAVASALRDGVEEACQTRLLPGELTPAEVAALPSVERWLRRRPPPSPPSAQSGCWKVRTGCGLVRVVLTRPRRRVVLVTVRAGAVAAVTAEHREGRALAFRLAAALDGHRLDAPVGPAEGISPEDAATVAGALAAARRLLG